MKNKNWSVRTLTEGAILIAVAEILSLLPLFKLPWGGSVDLAMLPVLLFCVRWGFGPSVLACFTHGVMQMLFAGGVAIGWQSMVGDYLLAYAVLCLAGLFKGQFCVGTVVACTARFLVHYVVGATLWAEYMPETFFGMTMTTPWIYSALYNGSFMALDLVIILVAYFLLTKTPLAKYFKREDLQ